MIFISANFLSSLSSTFISNVIRWKRKKAHVILLKRITEAVVYTIAFVFILGNLDINLIPIIGSLGAIIIVVGLAMHGLLRNFFAGIYISSDNLLDVGDFIEIKDLGIKGYILEIGYRTTAIKALDGAIIILPNEKIADSVIVNYTYRPIDLYINTKIELVYDVEKIEEILLEIAKKVQKSLPEADLEFEPKIIYKKVENNMVEFDVILRARGYFEQFVLRKEFIKELIKRFNSEGIKPNIVVT